MAEVDDLDLSRQRIEPSRKLFGFLVCLSCCSVIFLLSKPV